MNRRKGIFPKFALLCAAMTSSLILTGCPQPEPSVNGCALTDAQKVLLNIDTANFGTFESFQVQGNQVVFKNGIIPPTTFLQEWLEYNRNNPDLPRFHDFRIFGIKNKYVAEGLNAMFGVQIVDYKGKAIYKVGNNEFAIRFMFNDVKNAILNKETQCILIDELKVSAEEIGPFEGTITLFRPKKGANKR